MLVTKIFNHFRGELFMFKQKSTFPSQDSGIEPSIGTLPPENGIDIVPPIGTLPPHSDTDITLPIGTLPPEYNIVPPVGIAPPIGTCLSSQSVRYITELQNFFIEQLQLARTFQSLARQYPRQGRTLRGMAADNLQIARELRSAYFIISGIQLNPNEYEALNLPRSYEAALRAMYNYLDGLAERYRNAAAYVQDECLREIYYRAAANAVDQRNLVRSMIAQI